MAFPNVGGPQAGPFEGCRGKAETRTAIRFHFLHRHVRYTVIILKDVNIPHLRCPRCEMLVTWNSLNGQHVTTAQCDKGVERKMCWLSIDEIRDSTEQAFQSYSRPIKTVASFKYLGRIITA